MRLHAKNYNRDIYIWEIMTSQVSKTIEKIIKYQLCITFYCKKKFTCSFPSYCHYTWCVVQFLSSFQSEVNSAYYLDKIYKKYALYAYYNFD